MKMMVYAAVLGVLALLCVIASCEKNQVLADMGDGMYFPVPNPDDPPPSLNNSAVNSDLGYCVCDLTENNCDVYCCCDVVCVALGYVGTLFGKDECLPSGPAPSEITFCTDKGEIAESNINKIDHGLVWFDTQLCVVKENNPSKGTFYHSPSTIPSSFGLNSVESYEYFSTPQTTLTTTSSSYTAGERISILTGSSRQFSSNFALPSSGIGQFGSCSLSNPNFITIMNNDDSSEDGCVSFIDPTTTKEGCDSYSIMPYLDISLQCSDSKLLDLTTVLSISGIGFNSTSSDIFYNSSLIPIPIWDSATVTCSNMLKSLQYNIGYNRDGILSTSFVTAEFGSYTAENVTNSEFNSWPQLFSVVFYSINASNSNTLVNDIPYVRPRSGFPGYVVGLPVLSGNLTTFYDSSSSAMREIVLQPNQKDDFLSILGIGSGKGGQCDIWDREVVNFGEDVISGCSLNVPLTSLVPSSSDCASLKQTTYSMLTQTIVNRVIAQWGSANYTQIADWITSSVTVISQTSSNGNSDSLFYCNSVPVEIDLLFTYSLHGKTNNPQRKIASLSITIVEETVYSNCVGSNSISTCSENNNNQQQLYLQSVVNFLQIPARREEFVPGPASVFPKLSHDVFYPFQLNPVSSSSHIRPNFMLIQVTVVSLILFIFILDLSNTI